MIIDKIINWFKTLKAKKEAEEKFQIQKKYNQIICDWFITYNSYDIKNLTDYAEYCNTRAIKFRNSRCEKSALIHLECYTFYICDCDVIQYEKMYKLIDEQLLYCKGNKEETTKYLKLKSKIELAQKNLILLSNEEIILKLKKVKQWDKKKQIKKDFK